MVKFEDETYYWIERPGFGKVIGEVFLAEEGDPYVYFCGDDIANPIGTPHRSNPYIIATQWIERKVNLK